MTYRGATLNWYGRQLKTFIKNGTTIAMTYDADGLRSSKTVAGVKTEYQYVGDKLFYENRGNGDSFYYFYDSYGKLAALYHNRNGTKTAYHVVTNAQGDVVALYSWTGTKLAEYSYDAWGNCTIVSDSTSTGIATLNPFRYRGYYFDTDLGLYYLQSRYYDATIGRFINADNQLSIDNDFSELNLFVYCGNNSVKRIDPSGHAFETAWDVISIGVGVLDVWANPTDPWAWVGLTADLLDLIPFVTCLGETVRALRTIETIANITQVSNNTCNSPNSSTTIYRSVSKAEADDIVSSGQFNLAIGGMESKQFAFSYEETVSFGKKMGQDITVSAQLPTSMISQYYDGGVGGIDTTLFRSGTITVYAEQLDDFNDAVKDTIKFMP